MKLVHRNIYMRLSVCNDSRSQSLHACMRYATLQAVHAHKVLRFTGRLRSGGAPGSRGARGRATNRSESKHMLLLLLLVVVVVVVVIYIYIYIYIHTHIYNTNYHYV